MKLKQYQIDAFATRVFEGNPAAVCPLQRWLDDDLLQAIAMENNLSETAFFVPAQRSFHLRWFTPEAEVDLCGHATLASAHVLFEELGYAEPAIEFETRSGRLVVVRQDGRLVMDFPAQPPAPCAAPAALLEGLGRPPREVLAADDYVVVFDDEAIVRTLAPDLAKLSTLSLRGVCVTAPGAPGTGVDFISRFFAPRYGIPEDPVTGSARCELAPNWASRHGKTSFAAYQASPRGGHVLCEVRGDRVMLSGSAVTFLMGEMEIGE